MAEFDFDAYAERARIEVETNRQQEWDDLSETDKLKVLRLQNEYETNPQEVRSNLGEVGTGLLTGLTDELPGMFGKAVQAFSPEGSDIGRWGRDYAEEQEFESTLPENALQPDDHGFITNAFAAGAQSLPASGVVMAATALNPFLGAATTVGLFGGSSYQDSYDNVMEKTGDKGKAHEAGVLSAASQSVGEYLGSIVGLGFMKGGVGGGSISKILGKLENPQALKQFGKKTFTTGLGEATTESLQDAGTSYAEAKQTGEEVNPWEIIKQSAPPAIAMTIMLGPLAALGHVRQNSHNAKLVEIATSNKNKIEDRLIAAAGIHEQLKKADKTEAALWLKGTSQAINRGANLKISDKALRKQGGSTKGTKETDTKDSDSGQLGDTINVELTDEERAKIDEVYSSRQSTLNRQATSSDQFGDVIPHSPVPMIRPGSTPAVVSTTHAPAAEQGTQRRISGLLELDPIDVEFIDKTDNTQQIGSEQPLQLEHKPPEQIGYDPAHSPVHLGDRIIQPSGEEVIELSMSPEQFITYGKVLGYDVRGNETPEQRTAKFNQAIDIKLRQQGGLTPQQIELAKRKINESVAEADRRERREWLASPNPVNEWTEHQKAWFNHATAEEKQEMGASFGDVIPERVANPETVDDHKTNVKTDIVEANIQLSINQKNYIKAEVAKLNSQEAVTRVFPPIDASGEYAAGIASQTLPLQPTPQVTPESTTNERGGKSILEDKRLRQKHYRAGITGFIESNTDGLSGDMVGTANFDEQGNAVSVNVSSNLESLRPAIGLAGGVAKLKIAVNKALNGEPLGVRQYEAAQIALDAMEFERARNVTSKREQDTKRRKHGQDFDDLMQGEEQGQQPEENDIGDELLSLFKGGDNNTSIDTNVVPKPTPQGLERAQELMKKIDVDLATLDTLNAKNYKPNSTKVDVGSDGNQMAIGNINDKRLRREIKSIEQSIHSGRAELAQYIGNKEIATALKIGTVGKLGDSIQTPEGVGEFLQFSGGRVQVRFPDGSTNNFSGISTRIVDSVAKGEGSTQQTTGSVPRVVGGASLNGKGQVVIKAGDVFETTSGRQTTPYPKYSLKRTTKREEKEANQWLIDNYLAEAEARGDKFNVTLAKGLRADNFSSADSEGASYYLFEAQPEVIKRPTRTIIEPSTVTITSPVNPMSTETMEVDATKAQKSIDKMIAKLENILDCIRS